MVGLNEFLAAGGPVLVSWPQAFLFRSVADIVGTADGLSGALRAVIEVPRRTTRTST